MSGITRGIVGAITIPLAFGVVQLASEPGLAGAPQDLLETPEATIKRADRADGVGRFALKMQTMSIRFDEQDTSILVHVPIAKGTRKRSYTPSQSKSEDRKSGCEPAVSIFSEVFTQLQPGRCIT
jgi:hypothetical protein